MSTILATTTTFIACRPLTDLVLPAKPTLPYHRFLTQGDIIAQLDGEKAPISTANFLNYAKTNHYDGTIWHRVIPNFMIQVGGLFTVIRMYKQYLM